MGPHCLRNVYNICHENRSIREGGYRMRDMTDLPLWLKRMVGLPFVLLIVVTIGKATIFIMFVNPLVAEFALPQPIPMPDLPPVLASLPASARIRDSELPSMDSSEASTQNFVDVWTHPATFPSRPDDSVYDWTPSGDRGARQGRVPRGTQVRVTEYAWSSIEGEFFVRIQVASMRRPDQEGKSGQQNPPTHISGWIPINLLVFQ